MIANILEISVAGELIGLGVLIIILGVAAEAAKRERDKKVHIKELEIEKDKEARWTDALKIRDLEDKIKSQEKSTKEVAQFQSQLDEKFRSWQSNEKSNGKTT